jgi:large subunit ribosomal protein L13
VLTGRKVQQKVYYHHTNYIGGIKERTRKSILEGRFPERIVEKAIERMLPRGRFGRAQLGHLRVYPGPEHPHEAQQPETLDIGQDEPQEKRSA